MNREVHVRICGSREVQALPATRPAEIISHCVWLYYRFPLSFRDVEEMMLQRRIVVSHETIRQWAAKFGQTYASAGSASSYPSGVQAALGSPRRPSTLRRCQARSSRSDSRTRQPPRSRKEPFPMTSVPGIGFDCVNASVVVEEDR
jgi:hypothetical protein